MSFFNDYDFDGYERQVSYLWPIIALNIVVFILCGFGADTHLAQILKFHPYLVCRFQIWRVITYMFVHADLSHLFFNMWGLYIFGRYVERELGNVRFLILYLVSGVIGACTWSVFNISFDDLRVINEIPTEQLAQWMGGLVGASGAVFGVMTAAAMAFPDMQILLIFPPISMRLKHLIWVYVVIEVVESFNVDSHVAHLAHLGGALGGFLYIKRLWRKWRDEY